MLINFALRIFVCILEGINIQRGLLLIVGSQDILGRKWADL
jgi:hypothetical protein